MTDFNSIITSRSSRCENHYRGELPAGLIPDVVSVQLEKEEIQQSHSLIDPDQLQFQSMIAEDRNKRIEKLSKDIIDINDLMVRRFVFFLGIFKILFPIQTNVKRLIVQCCLKNRVL